jgi:alpha-beta hydrolase superfamily lysophospholipase
MVAYYRIFLVLADHLARQGIAVLRYADRRHARSRRRTARSRVSRRTAPPAERSPPTASTRHGISPSLRPLSKPAAP